MAKYRKKPVVIEARRLNALDYDECCDIVRWCSGRAVGPEEGYGENAMLVIPTLEGEIIANADDWIIKGVKGEFYPCKPDIFEATYELVEE